MKKMSLDAFLEDRVVSSITSSIFRDRAAVEFCRSSLCSEAESFKRITIQAVFSSADCTLAAMLDTSKEPW